MTRPSNPDGPAKVGLAFSGGGIRSATFNLGILQGLAKLGLLTRFDYLSTVSGGGYIGGWLISWIRRQAGGVRRVQDILKDGGEERPGLENPEPRQIQFLREYSNYLTPRAGLMSGDTWAAIASYVRNLFLNLLILVLALVALLLVPRALVGLYQALTSLRDDNALPVLAIVAVALIFLAGFVSALNFRESDVDISEKFSPRWVLYRGPPWIIPVLVGFVPFLAAIVARDWGQAIMNTGLIALASVVVWVLRVWAHDWTTGGSSGSSGNDTSQKDAPHDPEFYRKRKGVGLLVVLPVIVAAWVIGVCLTYAQPDIWLGLYVWQMDTVVWVAAGAAGHFFLWLVIWYVAGAQLRTFLPTAIPAVVTGAIGGFLLRMIPFVVATLLPVEPGVRQARAEITVTGRFVDDPAAVAAAIVALPLVLTVLGIVGALFIGLAGRDYPDEAREWWSRLVGVVAMWALAVTVLSLVAMYGRGAWSAVAGLVEGWVGRAMASGWLLTTIAGVLIGKKQSSSGPDAKPGPKMLAMVAPYAFVLGLLLMLSALAEKLSESGVHRLMATRLPADWPPGLGNLGAALGIAAGLFLVAWVLSLRVDLNEFSMHATYRNRLLRCYLGASNPHPNRSPFTGFDPTDDKWRLNDFRAPNYDGPYPIVNATLNMVGGSKLAWQQRKATSYTFTPDSCGFHIEPEPNGLEKDKSEGELFGSGFRSMESYGEGIQLGTAMTISGAAASPAMGYHSSPALTFLMTVFNVRLGWWLRNPRRKWGGWLMGSGREGPRLGLLYLFAELLGQTNDERKFVYLSDGGHFENLGIYELVRRRCGYIVACDVEADPNLQFAGLGNAIEKCRTDFGVDIKIDVSGIRPKKDGDPSENHWAVGTISYPKKSDTEPKFTGWLVYIKASLTGEEPTDVLRYKSQVQRFPHESTADQWFSESQFESYRALGEHIAREVFSGPVSSLDACTDFNRELIEALRWSLGKKHLDLPAGRVELRPLVTPVGAAGRAQEVLLKDLDSLRVLAEGRLPEERDVLNHTEVRGIVWVWIQELLASYQKKQIGYDMDKLLTVQDLAESHLEPDEQASIQLIPNLWQLRRQIPRHLGEETAGPKISVFALQLQESERQGEHEPDTWTFGAAAVVDHELAYFRIRDPFRHLHLGRRALLMLQREARPERVSDQIPIGVQELFLSLSRYANGTHQLPSDALASEPTHESDA